MCLVFGCSIGLLQISNVLYVLVTSFVWEFDKLLFPPILRFQEKWTTFPFEGARRNFIFDCWQLMIVVLIHSHSLWIILYLNPDSHLNMFRTEGKSAELIESHMREMSQGTTQCDYDAMPSTFGSTICIDGGSWCHSWHLKNCFLQNTVSSHSFVLCLTVCRATHLWWSEYWQNQCKSCLCWWCWWPFCRLPARVHQFTWDARRAGLGKKPEKTVYAGEGNWQPSATTPSMKRW